VAGPVKHDPITTKQKPPGSGHGGFFLQKWISAGSTVLRAFRPHRPILEGST
jgi:hypothetical protein